MNDSAHSGEPAVTPSSPATGARGLVAARPAAVLAARCAAYAACSGLVASPHDLDVPAALAAADVNLADLPYANDLAALAAELAAADPAVLRAEYSGLFEVGDEGPPVPIREDLHTGQLAGTREDIVRFYEFFGYRLAEHFAWAPDHLSVELEFLHFLCYREAAADASGDALSYALGQLDFATRHPLRWLPGLASATAALRPGSRYARVVAVIADFVRADHHWQQATIGPATDAA